MKWSAALFVILAAVLPSGAQVLFNGTAYTQNFDSLPANSSGSTASNITFSDDSTLLGWYSSVSGSTNTSRASSGTASASGAGVYDWGTASGSDRALGTFSGVSGGFASSPTYIGVQLQNSSASTVTSVDIFYNVEQWRRNATQTTLTLEYLVTNASGNQITAGSYTPEAGSAVSGVTGASFGGLAGTTPVSLTLSGIAWTPGTYLWLRWSNDQGANTTSTALAVDDFSLAITPVPEPPFLGLVLGGLAAWAARRAWRTA